MFGLFKSSKNPTKPDTTFREAYNYLDAAPIADYFMNKTGISFEKQNSILQSKLSSFCKLRNITSFDQCLGQIKQNPRLEQELVDYLTTNETYFFREFNQIETLANDISTRKESVSILCAPCSTGEEIYSIVIALLEAGVKQDKFKLLGIDINQTALDKAREGLYNDRNVSKIPKTLIPRYFDSVEKKYQLKAFVRTGVQFKLMNLFDPTISQIGKFDYVMSRNMLIYFNKPTKERAQEVLTSLLKDKNQAVLYGHADLY